MDQIQYAGNALVTGSKIAHAVLAYAQALASNGDSATVTIPVLHEHGSVVTAEILIGPASQLIAEPYESTSPELEDADVVERLNEATAKLQPARAIADNAGNYSAIDDDDLGPVTNPLETD
jgi:hypothetical protein